VKGSFARIEFIGWKRDRIFNITVGIYPDRERGREGGREVVAFINSLSLAEIFKPHVFLYA